MQIVRSGKVSQLADVSVIRGKTFAIVQQFETPYNKNDKNSLENLRDRKLIRDNHEFLPPQTICILRYGLAKIVPLSQCEYSTIASYINYSNCMHVAICMHIVL